MLNQNRTDADTRRYLRRPMGAEKGGIIEARVVGIHTHVVTLKNTIDDRTFIMPISVFRLIPAPGRTVSINRRLYTMTVPEGDKIRRPIRIDALS